VLHAHHRAPAPGRTAGMLRNSPERSARRQVGRPDETRGEAARVIFSLDDTRWREFSLWTTHAGEKLVDRLVASVARSACQKSVAARLASRGQKSANRLPHVASCYRAASSLSALLPCAALGIEMFLSALSMVLAASCRFHGSLLDAALSLSLSLT
jgi:hypothetical protein